MNNFSTGAVGFIGFHTSRRLLESSNDYYDINLKNDRLKIMRKFDRFTFHKKT